MSLGGSHIVGLLKINNDNKIKRRDYEIRKRKNFQCNELVDYADGGVVSKELIHNTAGSVTLFSFDVGQGAQHTAPFDAFIQVIDGEIILNVEGTDNHIKTGGSYYFCSQMGRKEISNIIQY